MAIDEDPQGEYSVSVDVDALGASGCGKSNNLLTALQLLSTKMNPQLLKTSRMVGLWTRCALRLPITAQRRILPTIHLTRWTWDPMTYRRNLG